MYQQQTEKEPVLVSRTDSMDARFCNDVRASRKSLNTTGRSSICVSFLLSIEESPFSLETGVNAREEETLTSKGVACDDDKIACEISRTGSITASLHKFYILQYSYLLRIRENLTNPVSIQQDNESPHLSTDLLFHLIPSV